MDKFENKIWLSTRDFGKIGKMTDRQKGICIFYSQSATQTLRDRLIDRGVGQRVGECGGRKLSLVPSWLGQELS